MKFTPKNLIVLSLFALIFISCQFISNSFDYKDSSIDFMENVMDGKIENSYNQFALENDAFKNTDKDALKEHLYQFRNDMISQYGKDIEFSFLGATTTFYSTEEQSFPNSTIVNISFENKTDYGIIQFVFDNETHKILNVSPQYAKQPIPSMFVYYALILIGLLVVAINIYAIIKIKKSKLNRKWLKYLAVILLNFPTLYYSINDGFDFKLISFQSFGFGFNYASYYSNLHLTLPIGAIYWLWKLNQQKKIEEYNKYTEELIKD